MARIVMGNRDGALALVQARAVLAELGTEWPDVNIVHRTIQQPSGQQPSSQQSSSEAERDALIGALLQGGISIAVLRVDQLPSDLPDGIVLAAVTRRLEPRGALVARGQKSLAALPGGARVGVMSERDRRFLEASKAGFDLTVLSGALDHDLNLLAVGELDALVLPAVTLHEMDRRHRIDGYLDVEEFAPAPGQGSLGLLVREDDDMAYELAYSLQHRPSFDRIRAERSFARGLAGHTVGALASVSTDGELALFGAVATEAAIVQANTSGEASEAEDLGRELAQDVLVQLDKL